VSFVLDASATLAFIFPDERDDAAIALAQRLRRDSASAPRIWRWEVQNAIVVAERRGRYAAESIIALLSSVDELPIKLETPEGEFVTTFARRFGISVYDALYLDLAFRKQIPLATRDNKLIAAAGILGTKILHD
jgi:predicted nucleic acid-binding protein